MVNISNIIRGRWDFLNPPFQRKLAYFLLFYLGIALIFGNLNLPFTNLNAEVAGVSLKMIWGVLLIILGSWIWGNVV